MSSLYPNVFERNAHHLRRLWTKPVPPPPPPREPTVDELHEQAVREEAEREAQLIMARALDQRTAREREHQAQQEQEWHAERERRDQARRDQRAQAAADALARGELPDHLKPPPPEPAPPVQVEAFIRPPRHPGAIGTGGYFYGASYSPQYF